MGWLKLVVVLGGNWHCTNVVEKSSVQLVS